MFHAGIFPTHTRGGTGGGCAGIFGGGNVGGRGPTSLGGTGGGGAGIFGGGNVGGRGPTSLIAVVASAETFKQYLCVGCVYTHDDDSTCVLLVYIKTI